MSPVSRGFSHLRRASDEDSGRVPPGQYVTEGFPVLSAGPAPHTPLEKWTFSITQDRQTRKSWTWHEFQALPAKAIPADIHYVTRRSKLADVTGGQAWVAFGYDGGSLEASTAARPGCWCRTCTSGRAPSGCAA